MSAMEEDTSFIFSDSKSLLDFRTYGTHFLTPVSTFFENVRGNILNIIERHPQRVSIASLLVSCFLFVILFFALFASSKCSRSKISCKDGWTPYGHKCFKVVTYRQSFDKGALDCLRLGSEAASIQSAEENEWLSDLVRIVKWAPNLQHQGEFYIGLKYNGSSWQWSDGSHLTFENWHSGEPNELKTEQCVEVRAHNGDLNGSWNNVPCSAALYIVCQTQPE